MPHLNSVEALGYWRAFWEKTDRNTLARTELLLARFQNTPSRDEFIRQQRLFSSYTWRRKTTRGRTAACISLSRGLAVKPLAIGVGTRAADGTLLDQAGWETLITVERARWKADSRTTDMADCAAITEPVPPVTPLRPRASEHRQYLDVDCERANTSVGLRVPIDTVLVAQFKVQSAKAVIQDASNLKEARAIVVRTEPDAAIVQYSIVGLDRQFLGNCPGGGHGTLVVRFQLEPK